MAKRFLSFLFFTAFFFTSAIIVHGQTLTPAPSPLYIKYDLAYPGILPGSPLYKLKVLRDKISLGLINDPRKKIDYLLLQTDKGILATAILVDKGEIDLAQQTALKAENNYTLISQELFHFISQPNQTFFNKLKTASLKHQEVLQSIIKRVPQSKQEIFKEVIDFSQRNYKQIEKERSDMWK